MAVTDAATLPLIKSATYESFLPPHDGFLFAIHHLLIACDIWDLRCRGRDKSEENSE